MKSSVVKPLLVLLSLFNLSLLPHLIWAESPDRDDLLKLLPEDQRKQVESLKNRFRVVFKSSDGKIVPLDGGSGETLPDSVVANAQSLEDIKDPSPFLSTTDEAVESGNFDSDQSFEESKSLGMEADFLREWMQPYLLTPESVTSLDNTLVISDDAEFDIGNTPNLKVLFLYLRYLDSKDEQEIDQSFSLGNVMSRVNQNKQKDLKRIAEKANRVQDKVDSFYTKVSNMNQKGIVERLGSRVNLQDIFHEIVDEVKLALKELSDVSSQNSVDALMKGKDLQQSIDHMAYDEVINMDEMSTNWKSLSPDSQEEKLRDFLQHKIQSNMKDRTIDTASIEKEVKEVLESAIET
mmetsp:Transcript_27244/g.31450  ORF Transcript_27244/g.31450 Transcript_27244/m.31450 type:complete len:350 (+) Transcript_27244:137-1186(+)